MCIIRTSRIGRIRMRIPNSNSPRRNEEGIICGRVGQQRGPIERAYARQNTELDVSSIN